MAHTDDWIGFHKLDWDAILKTRKHKKLLLDEKKTFLDNISIVDQFRGKLSMAKKPIAKIYCLIKMPFCITFQLSNNFVAKFLFQKSIAWRKLSFLNNISIVEQFRGKISIAKKCCSGAYFINSFKCFVMEMQIRVPVWEGKNSGRKKEYVGIYHFECP